MLLALALLVGCPAPEPTPDEWPAIELASPRAGAAEGTLDLPVGSPMGGYSARCSCLSGQGRQDSRDSAYNTSFVASTGVHMRPSIKVVWLESAGEHLVIVKADVIYSFDGLVTEITKQLEAATGEELDGRVVLATTHSHSSYGPFSDTYHFALGGDLFNREIFERFAAEVTEVALQAHEKLEPAAIGTGWAKDWDPQDAVYRDRRGVNDDLKVWPDFEGKVGKDPYLNVIRVDAADDGAPIAVMFTFGVHGICFSETNSMLSPDSTGGLEWGVEEAFDEPVVVMHLQGSGGDQSPGGRGGGGDMARIESLGQLARGPIMDLWEQTPTSTAPLHLETASRHVWQYHDQIHVTRDGTVDWRYAPIEEDPHPDNVVYESDGSISMPIDEFNAPNGAAFCGDGSFDFPVGGLNVDVPPYDACMDVELITNLLYAFFELPPESIPLPLPESFTTATTVTRMGPLATREADGTTTERDFMVGFFPGEPLYLFAEQWRRRVEAELGLEMPLLVGYAQDHEGYLLIPEDWLMGGYEPNIAIWGPLQGEHIMERTLEYADELLSTTDVREDPDPTGWYAPPVYDHAPLPTIKPDTTPDAGNRLTTVPERYLWLPDGFELDLEIPEEVPRGTGVVQILWDGGDPAVDLPVVALERQVDATTWEPAKTHSGRPVTDAMGDILVAWTPLPLYPSAGDQTHTWWATWQAAAHDGDRLALPLGTYRFTVTGKRYTGTAQTWPWDTADYTFSTEPFEVVPATLGVEAGTGGLWVWFDAPSVGWRMIDTVGAGNAKGRNPIRSAITVVVDTGAETRTTTVTPSVSGDRGWVDVDLSGAVSLTVTDAAGNAGTLSF